MFLQKIKNKDIQNIKFIKNYLRIKGHYGKKYIKKKFNINIFLYENIYYTLGENIQEITNFYKNIRNIYRLNNGGIFKKLYFNSLGYRVSYKKDQNILTFIIGYSLPKNIFINKNIIINLKKKKKFFLYSNSKKTIQDFALNIENLRYPDIYKNKGILINLKNYRKKLGKLSQR